LGIDPSDACKTAKDGETYIASKESFLLFHTN
jgi:hypothetical protein